ncbi:MAG: CinA family protein [Succinivibrio sp.]|nr:CinA family protein [Succinivibrio sp.]
MYNSASGQNGYLEPACEPVGIILTPLEIQIYQKCLQQAAVLGSLYAAYHQTYAVAESLTGGLIGECLVSIPGSSQWFERGFITYANQAKIEDLGVSAEVISTQGAVSAACAAQMVEGALQRSKASLAVSVTGIAGPGGGTEHKPIGTVFFGIKHREGPAYVHEEHFQGSRSTIRYLTALEALSALTAITSGQPPHGYQEV